MARRALTALLAVALVLGSTATVFGAEASVGSVKGQKYKMADAVIAASIDVLTDTDGDQTLTDGSAASNAPKWTDVVTVRTATAKTPAKLRNKMESLHPPGAIDAFYGSVARPRVGERIIFVAVQMARRMPANARGQLVEVGLAGRGATPVQVGTDHDTHAGVERFSLSGLFKNGIIATGDTSVVGKEPGVELADEEYYNEESGVYGFYRPRNATWYLAIPREDDVNVITVAVRSTTADGLVVDRLALPDSGHFIDLRAPAGGYKKNAGLPALSCRAIETFSGEGGDLELSDIDATLIRYTAGVDASVGRNKRTELLRDAAAAAGPVPVALTAVGAGAEPTTVDGQLSVTPEGNAIELTFEAPAGQWRFELADALTTGAGELLVDHSSLTGPAGVRTGPGLDGLAVGDRSCVAPGPAGDASEVDGATEDDAEAPNDEAADDEAADDEAAEEAAANEEGAGADATG